MKSSFLSQAGRALVPALPCLIFLAFFFGIPVFEILHGSLYGQDGSFGIEQYQRMASTTVYVKVLWTTFLISVLTALFSVLLGYPVAYFLSQLKMHSRGRWMIWLMIPFWTSYLVKTFAWLLVLSKTGVLSSVAVGLGLISDPVAVVPSLTGVMIGMVHAMLPLAVMNMLPIMQSVNSQLVQAAETLGANRSVAFFSVFLPLSAPGAAAAGLLVFITSLGFFILPALLGGPQETMVAQLVISSILELLNLPFAGALSTVLLICAIGVFLLYDRLVGLSSLSGDAKAAAPRGKGRTRGLTILVTAGRLFGQVGALFKPVLRSGHGLKAYVGVVVAMLSLPILVVLPIAFTDSPFLEFPPKGFSLRWFEAFLFSPIWQAALLRSLGVATATALAATALGLGAALALTRVPSQWTKSLFAFLLAPLIVPRIVIAVGLFYLFARLGLNGTDLGLIIGHTVLAIPYVVVTMVAALKNFDWRLDDAARILGASGTARLRTVLLPMMLPSLLAALQFAFIVSFDELTIAIFVSGGLKTTLPKQMWDDMILQVNPTLAAVSVVLFLFITLLVLIPTLFKSRK